MSRTWIAFARTGNPNTAGLGKWPAFDLKSRSTMVFDRDSRVVDDPRGRERRMFGQVPYVQPGT
jgi:para-nitrobenzyl esterase